MANKIDQGNAPKQDVDKAKLTLQVDLPENDDLIVCKVCGHKNRRNAGLCEMCSNYLFDN